jgi:imidazoleglycerol phosphate synthase glutamine amidotransferase subunit HisH
MLTFVKNQDVILGWNSIEINVQPIIEWYRSRIILHTYYFERSLQYDVLTTTTYGKPLPQQLIMKCLRHSSRKKTNV